MAQTKTFEQSFKDLVEIAVEEAKKWGHSEIDTDHLLMALLASEDTPSYNLLKEIANASMLKGELEEKMSRVSGQIPLLPTELTKQAKSAYEFAGHSYVYNERKPRLDPPIHFLLGIIDQGENAATKLLQKYDITRSRIVEHIEKYRTQPIASR